MTVEVAVVGSPFLDLTFEALPRMPRPGEELVAQALHLGPGGTGMQAVGLARLGVDVAIVAPIGGNGAAQFLRDVLKREKVQVVPEGGSGTPPTTALLATPEGVAMATALGSAEPTAEDVSAADPAAVVLSLGRARLAPPAAERYFVTGALELERITDSMLTRLAGARAFVANASEAIHLTGARDAEHAARDLAGRGTTAVVTLGAEGAIAADGRGIVRAGGETVDVVDATGAGDLFVAAYVWADRGGGELSERLAWASLYACLSVRAPTALLGAVRLDELLDEGRSRGLSPP